MAPRRAAGDHACSPFLFTFSSASNVIVPRIGVSGRLPSVFPLFMVDNRGEGKQHAEWVRLDLLRNSAE